MAEFNADLEKFLDSVDLQIQQLAGESHVIIHWLNEPQAVDVFDESRQYDVTPYEVQAVTWVETGEEQLNEHSREFPLTLHAIVSYRELVRKGVPIEFAFFGVRPDKDNVHFSNEDYVIVRSEPYGMWHGQWLGIEITGRKTSHRSWDEDNANPVR